MTRVFRASLGLALLGALASPACTVPPSTVQQVVQGLTQQAALALKALDESGVELPYTADQIAQVLVGGKPTPAKFDDQGNLLVELPADQSTEVQVQLSSGQSLSLPVQAKKEDFQSGKPPVFGAFLLPGAQAGQLSAQLVRPGQSRVEAMGQGAIRLPMGDPKLTEGSLKRVYLGRVELPRQAVFVKDGDLFIHAAAVFATGANTTPNAAPPVLRLFVVSDAGKVGMISYRLKKALPKPQLDPQGRPDFTKNPPPVAAADLEAPTREELPPVAGNDPLDAINAFLTSKLGGAEASPNLPPDSSRRKKQPDIRPTAPNDTDIRPPAKPDPTKPVDIKKLEPNSGGTPPAEPGSGGIFK